MKQLNIFFRTFWKSVSSLAYYRDVVKAPFSFSFKYFIFFSFLLGLTLAISSSLAILPPVSKFTARLSTRSQTLFPPDLVITIKNGELSTNAIEPLKFPIPFELFTDTPPAISDQKQLYLATIDTKARAADFSKSQSLVLLTKTSIVVKDEDSDYRIFPLKDLDDVTFDKAVVDEFLRTIRPLLGFIPALIILVLLGVFLVLLPISRLLSLLFLSLVLLIAAQVMKVILPYSKIYQIGLHALTLPTLIQIGLTVIGVVPPIPFFNSILYLLLALAILAEFKRSSALTTRAPENKVQ